MISLRRLKLVIAVCTVVAGLIAVGNGVLATDHSVDQFKRGSGGNIASKDVTVILQSALGGGWYDDVTLSAEQISLDIQYLNYACMPDTSALGIESNTVTVFESEDWQIYDVHHSACLILYCSGMCLPNEMVWREDQYGTTAGIYGGAWVIDPYWTNDGIFRHLFLLGSAGCTTHYERTGWTDGRVQVKGVITKRPGATEGASLWLVDKVYCDEEWHEIQRVQIEYGPFEEVEEDEETLQKSDFVGYLTLSEQCDPDHHIEAVFLDEYEGALASDESSICFGAGCSSNYCKVHVGGSWPVFIGSHPPVYVFPTSVSVEFSPNRF
ncbi:MAG: hypothetical protein P9M00_09025 [Candidatus Tritonobacter lacicola]|nr:hypothetical protein [Candidatus Tritonobacter lacicola]